MKAQNKATKRKLKARKIIIRIYEFIGELLFILAVFFTITAKNISAYFNGDVVGMIKTVAIIVILLVISISMIADAEKCLTKYKI